MNRIKSTLSLAVDVKMKNLNYCTTNYSLNIKISKYYFILSLLDLRSMSFSRNLIFALTYKTIIKDEYTIFLCKRIIIISWALKFWHAMQKWGCSAATPSSCHRPCQVIYTRATSNVCPIFRPFVKSSFQNMIRKWDFLLLSVVLYY